VVAGAFFAVYLVTSLYTPLRYWVLDTAKGRRGVGIGWGVGVDCGREGIGGNEGKGLRESGLSCKMVDMK
jgi:hypothetical protein